MKIPSDFYFNRILNSKIEEYYQQIKDLEDSEQICIVLYFLFEFREKENSDHYDYIASLPKDESYFPIFYSDENRNLLKGSIMINYMNKYIRKIKSEFEFLKNKFIELKEVEIREYIKVRLTLGARIFETDKINHVNSAVPIADLFNFHPEKVNCSWKVDEKKNFTVQAIKDIGVDEEVTPLLFKINNYLIF